MVTHWNFAVPQFKEHLMESHRNFQGDHNCQLNAGEAQTSILLFLPRKWGYKNPLNDAEHSIL